MKRTGAPVRASKPHALAARRLLIAPPLPGRLAFPMDGPGGGQGGQEGRHWFPPDTRTIIRRGTGAHGPGEEPDRLRESLFGRTRWTLHLTCQCVGVGFLSSLRGYNR